MRQSERSMSITCGGVTGVCGLPACLPGHCPLHTCRGQWPGPVLRTTSSVPAVTSLSPTLASHRMYMAATFCGVARTKFLFRSFQAGVPFIHAYDYNNHYDCGVTEFCVSYNQIVATFCAQFTLGIATPDPFSKPGIWD